MPYDETIPHLAHDPEQLENEYQAARRAGDADSFRQAIDAIHAADPDNVLIAAWYFRLQNAAERVREVTIAWPWVLPLAVLNGVLFWVLSDERFTIRMENARFGTTYDLYPAVLLAVGPIAALFVLGYLVAVGRRRPRLALIAGAIPLAAVAYVFWAYPQAGTRPFQEQYLGLMLLHLPLLAWSAVGAYLVPERSNATGRFAFLIKSFELLIMAGLFVIAGGLFTGISFSLFGALGIEPSSLMQRLFIAGGGGLIPVIAAAIVYDPTLPPAEQSFDAGLSKLLALLLRILLPPALLVLLVYIAFIPFNFREPFNNRDVLIIFNGMLFAVVALLVGATPTTAASAAMPPRLARWLRRGLLALALLALVVSVYALTAILYRTILDRLTPNRLAFIGWNVINIGLLILVLRYQRGMASGEWRAGLYRAYSVGTILYAVWTVAMILLLPWLFRIDQGAIEALPPTVQAIVLEQPEPIVLKCTGSPHIFVLTKGKKRWIADLETFERRGYVWGDVSFVPCADLAAIPDGVPIPSDAGPPPPVP